MIKILLRASVACAVLAAADAGGSAAAQNSYPGSAEEQEELRQWDSFYWRTTTGREGGGQNRPANGYTLNPQVVGGGGAYEEVNGVLYKYRKAKGSWAFYEPGKPPRRGTSELSFNKKGMIYGWLTPSDGGEPIEYLACRLPGNSHSYSFYSGSWLWSRRASYARQGNGLTVTIEFQNVDTWIQTLNFSAMEASFVSADGKVAKADRIVAPDGTQMTERRIVDICETQAYTFHFPDVPFTGNRLKLTMGGKLVGDWPTYDEGPPAGAPAPAPTPSPAPPPPPSGYTPSATDLNTLRLMENTTWRSNQGYQGDTRRPSDNYLNLVTFAPDGSAITQEVGGTLDRAGHATGNFHTDSGPSLMDRGVAEFSFDTERVHGTITGTDGKPKPYFACRVTGKTSMARHSGGWLWSARVSFARQGEGALATVEFQNVSDQAQLLDFSAFTGAARATDGRKAMASKPRSASGETMLGRRSIGSCETQTYTVPFGSVPFATNVLELGMGESVIASWMSPLSAPEPAPQPAPEPTPPPAPTPPAPAPQPTPAPPPTPAPGPSGPGIPSGAANWQLYGSLWSYRVDELKQGPDGNWQAIVSVRAEANRIGMASAQIEMALINADGETIRQAGRLYRPSVTGPAKSLEPIIGTQWMQKGDTIRVRLLFEESKDLHPTRLRIADTGYRPVSRDFALR